MAMQSLEAAFIHELRDVLSAEKQLTEALPKMAKAASTEQLREAFEAHLKETQGQIDRLETVFEAVGEKASEKKCEAMAGIVKEGEHTLKQEADASVKDAMLIASAQKAEHYEIATYGTLVVWAQRLGHHKAVEQLKATLQEEEKTDEKLSKIAEQGVNRAAA